jgi:hypothetical protein
MAFDGLCESYISAIEIEFLFFFFGYPFESDDIHYNKVECIPPILYPGQPDLKPKEPRPNNVHEPLAFSIHTKIF